ncbi:GATS protein-like 3 [Apophysomyces ossiformis]|uniref:GATS protein-like 3 n=1 Tax=Apophysomyces ossiformis TaxID=679940 RepID=A0A8H7BWQ3_9FUNG|nr:GATS protein-like 3 [Apophysomyces ossiformis]
MITLLHAKVKLLHFPRSHLPHVTHAIIKACFFHDTKDERYFFSLTENAYEISIVANQEAIDNDFMPILLACQCPGLAVSSDLYRILQVDDEGGQDSSGKRISDLSGPLAQGRFSIFYMSTYQTDFVLIKERRLRRAVHLLQEHGFKFDEDSLASGIEDTLQQPITEQSNNDSDPEELFNVLQSEMRCVGLNPHYRSAWAMTLLKVLAYPELVIDNYSTENTRFFSYTASSEGISLITDNRFLAEFEQDVIFQEEDSASLRVIQVNLAGSNLDRCGIVRSISHPLVTEAHINLLYLSTFKSANILVPAADLEKAREVMATDLVTMRGMLSEMVLEPR